MWFFVRQPNGRLAVFSSEVMNFTVFGLTSDEALLYAAVDYPTDLAEGKVRAAVEDTGPFNEAPGSGYDRYRSALRLIAAQHGAAAREDAEADGGYIPQECLNRPGAVGVEAP